MTGILLNLKTMWYIEIQGCTCIWFIGGYLFTAHINVDRYAELVIHMNEVVSYLMNLLCADVEGSNVASNKAMANVNIC